MDEFAHFRLNMRFVLLCRYLRWRLRLGLEPWSYLESCPIWKAI